MKNKDYLAKKQDLLNRLDWAQGTLGSWLHNEPDEDETEDMVSRAIEDAEKLVREVEEQLRELGVPESEW